MKFTVIKKRFIAVCCIFILIGLLWLYFGISIAETISNAILHALMPVACTTIFIYEVFWGSFSTRIRIGADGVRYIKRKEEYFLKWDDIKQIGLVSNIYARITSNSMVCFDGRGSSGFEFEMNGIKKYNQLYFGVQYREKVINEIKKYWDKPIIGTYQALK